MPTNDPLPPWGEAMPIDRAARDIAEVVDPQPYLPQLRLLFDQARAVRDKAMFKQLSPTARKRLALVAALNVEDIINGGPA